MTKHVIRFLATANADVKSIYDWIVASSGHAAVAEKFIERIFDRCDQLAEFPEIGVARNDLSPGIRLLVFEKRAAIFYRVRNDEVIITNIMYRGRDYDETTFEA